MRDLDFRLELEGSAQAESSTIQNERFLNLLSQPNIMSGPLASELTNALRGLVPNINRDVLNAYRRAGGSVDALLLQQK